MLKFMVCIIVFCQLANSTRNSDTPPFPQSLEQLLERSWEQGSTFLMEQAQHFDGKLDGMIIAIKFYQKYFQFLQTLKHWITSLHIFKKKVIS